LAGADYYALEDRVATHFAVMRSLAGLLVTGALGISPANDERLVADGATTVVLIERVDGTGDALESVGSRDPIAMTASTAIMARLRRSSVTVDRQLAAHASHLPWLSPLPGPGTSL
jgi:hypothetical protein